MSAYLTHIIMGEEVYNNCFNDYKLFKCDIGLSNFKASCLSVDLSKFCSVSYFSHNRDTDIYFFNMIDYVKENKLYLDKDVMAILYGSICHYYLDVYTHPLIYYVSCNCLSSGIISPHDLTEGYISSYMLSKKNILNYDYKYLGNINFSSRNLTNVLNYTYYRTYNYGNINDIYNLTFNVIKLLEKCVNKIDRSKLISLVGFNQYLKLNNLTRNEIVNDNKDIWSNPITGEIYNYSFMELYDKAIIKSCEVIDLVNKYIYDGIYVDLFSLFTNLSYDTGVSCLLGRNFTYVKRK